MPFYDPHSSTLYALRRLLSLSLTCKDREVNCESKLSDTMPVLHCPHRRPPLPEAGEPRSGQRCGAPTGPVRNE